MKVLTKIGVGSILILSVLTSCGISQEVQVASDQLVKVQESTMKTQTTFHKAIIKQLNVFLDIELKRSAATYDTAVAIQSRGQLQAIDEAYSDSSLTLAKRKVAEIEAQQLYIANIEKAKVNRIARDQLLNKSKENLIASTKAIMAAEEMKLKVLMSQSKYLNTKRPSDRILDMMNIDTDQFTGYINDASGAINETRGLIDQYSALMKTK